MTARLAPACGALFQTWGIRSRPSAAAAIRWRRARRDNPGTPLAPVPLESGQESRRPPPLQIGTGFSTSPRRTGAESRASGECRRCRSRIPLSRSMPACANLARVLAWRSFLPACGGSRRQKARARGTNRYRSDSNIARIDRSEPAPRPGGRRATRSWPEPSRDVRPDAGLATTGGKTRSCGYTLLDLIRF